ncbi:hypothetical protein [Streptosporangium sp. 'caverna']|uniref:hypothetical protein n=1 Tax=Streptosporangium sp. 'caverna' TaxID=2202249 RepID=UPI000D7E5303|nr:hypothetical protein [Streptosporangium sp. 'caverna']AWS47408.1 hypothetical protein DKM19_45095 [Streptosporangium sp. 'caverna']
MEIVLWAVITGVIVAAVLVFTALSYHYLQVRRHHQTGRSCGIDDTTTPPQHPAGQGSHSSPCGDPDLPDGDGYE